MAKTVCRLATAFVIWISSFFRISTSSFVIPGLRQQCFSISARQATICFGMKLKLWRIAGINFDHFHMGDLLRMASERPRAELVGISDEAAGRMDEAIRKLGIPRERCFADY